ncbi:hypothetical protein [Parabacteroides faecis]|uniref:Conjugative transposon protein TraJ n=1 Tax=Parabacteroides faecis TaxID=1217282 RepID=A0ABR6KPG5_9BACT|nr:hypothetical protein [Parabacteroides faecis]MBB4622739.1 hypothetical protein [Parabacteroides faecis]
MKAGFVGGALSAAFSGISGGLIRGFTDMAKGYSFGMEEQPLSL